MDIAKIGVIGAGQMGTGIAQVCALAGIDVFLNDVTEAKTHAGIEAIRLNLGRLVDRKTVETEAAAAALPRISGAPDLVAFGDCDLVIEAASENEEVKRKIFGMVCPHLRADALLASNTSSISITRLAASTDRPEKFIGMHFMNPAVKMQLVELIRGIATEDGTFETAKALIARLGKTATSSEDFPAFIVNRILLPMINEAIYTLYEGVGSVEAIDTAMKLGANHPMGPLTLADYIGLDTLLSVMQCCTRGWQTRSIGRARCWSNMSRPAGSAARRSAASTTTAAARRSRRVSRYTASIFVVRGTEGKPRTSH